MAAAVPCLPIWAIFLRQVPTITIRYLEWVRVLDRYMIHKTRCAYTVRRTYGRNTKCEIEIVCVCSCHLLPWSSFSLDVTGGSHFRWKWPAMSRSSELTAPTFPRAPLPLPRAWLQCTSLRSHSFSTRGFEYWMCYGGFKFHRKWPSEVTGIIGSDHRKWPQSSEVTELIESDHRKWPVAVLSVRSLHTWLCFILYNI